jgi:hypothetical protein
LSGPGAAPRALGKDAPGRATHTAAASTDKPTRSASDFRNEKWLKVSLCGFEFEELSRVENFLKKDEGIKRLSKGSGV